MHKRCYAIAGIRRSGIHLVADWILRQFNPATLFNECPPNGDPWQIPANICPLADRDGHFPDPAEPQEAIALAFEDQPLERIAGRTVERYTGAADRLWTVLLLRDPWNMLASRLKWAQLPANTAPQLCDPCRGRDLWVEYAREATGRSRILADRSNGHVVVVLYNWFARHDDDGARYRRYIGRQLGLHAPSPRIRHVPPHGGGSSFDRCTFDGRAEQMAVADRWKQLGGDMQNRLWRLTADPPALRGLALDLFGPQLLADTWPHYEAFCHFGPSPPAIRLGSQLCKSPPSVQPTAGPGSSGT